VGWKKKGVGHEVFLTGKGGAHLKMLVQKGGVQLFIIVEKNLTCNNYCYHREVAIIVVLPVHWFAVSSPSEIRA
jgi:tellurite resistance-related uncharacterized protein